MKANTYKDDNAVSRDLVDRSEDADLQSEPDPMKPLLDRMIDMIVAGLSGKARDFYDLEFTFFDAVTSISGKLKPYIKKSKPEKKAKIDEEMMKIKLSVGVYLPSNPDGSVIDLDRKSGRPLQSHAKVSFFGDYESVKRKALISGTFHGHFQGSERAIGASDRFFDGSRRRSEHGQEEIRCLAVCHLQGRR